MHIQQGDAYPAEKGQEGDDSPHGNQMPVAGMLGALAVCVMAEIVILFAAAVIQIPVIQGAVMIQAAVMVEAAVVIDITAPVLGKADEGQNGLQQQDECGGNGDDIENLLQGLQGVPPV